MILLYSNSMINNCCQSLNGLEQINADVIILDGANVETELNDLQTQIDNLQTEITNGGGYFQVICERNGGHQNGVYFSFGANSTTGDLKTYLPNCVVYGIAISSGGTITSAVDVEVIINSTTHTYSVPAGTNAVYTNYNLSIAVSQGQTLQAKFGTAGSGGNDFRISLFCRTSAVNGQNVSFYTPNFTLLNANQNAYLTDTITTSNNTQNHQLHFGIPRGRSVYAYLGSVSSGTAAVSMDSTTNTNGNQEITFNFVLQTGAQGSQGPKGDKGDDGNADPIVLAIAAAAGAAAGGGAGAAAGAAAGSSAGASSGAAAANAVLAGVEEQIGALETQATSTNAKIQFFVEHTPASLLTECGGSTCSLHPTNTLNLGGAVFGSGNNTNNINMYCTDGMVVNTASTQFVNQVEMLNDLNVDGDVDMNGQVNITENLTCLSDIALNTFLEFTNGSAYASNTFQSFPAVAPTNNNQGKLVLNSNIFTSYAKSELFNNQQIAQYPYLTFKTDAGFSGFDYGTIFCDTLAAPPVNNGGDFTFACNQLTTTNNLVVNGDLQVVGNFNIDNLTINNLTVNTALKTSLIQPLDNNVVIDIGSATTELNLTAQLLTATAETISIGANDNVNVVELVADSLSIGENVNCGIIDIGNNATTETNINGLDLGVNTEIINLGQNGTTTQITARADAIVIGDTTTHGKTTTIDTQNINIGINDTAEYPSNINIGSVESQVILTGDNIDVGDNFTTALNIIGATIAMGNSNITTDTINIDPTYINIGVNDDPAYPSNIIIGSENSITDLYGDVITIGDPNSTNTTRFLGTTCNILTNGTSIRTNALTMGSNYTTTANLTAQEITFLGTTSTTLRGDTINIGNDNSTDTIQIGNSVSYTEIEGSQINMGVGSVLNTINIGNAFSVVNIAGNPNNAINVAGMFFNQIGF